MTEKETARFTVSVEYDPETALAGCLESHGEVIEMVLDACGYESVEATRVTPPP